MEWNWNFIFIGWFDIMDGWMDGEWGCDLFGKRVDELVIR